MLVSDGTLVVPLTTTGDGSCLLHAISRAGFFSKTPNQHARPRVFCVSWYADLELRGGGRERRREKREERAEEWREEKHVC